MIKPFQGNNGSSAPGDRRERRAARFKSSPLKTEPAGRFWRRTARCKCQFWTVLHKMARLGH
jgi:hypothetical protein